MGTRMQSGGQILIVDDDRFTITLLSAVLRQAGYEVIQATSGESAWEIVLKQEPDIALLDIQMPGMSGLDLAKRLDAETTVPFMFLSASKDDDIVKSAIEYGAVGYLVKPIDAESLKPAIEAGLARSQEIKHLRRSEAKLTGALVAGRETSVAVGLLMARFRTDREMAFEVLRDYARSNRRKINEVANELLAAEEVLNRFTALFSKRNG